MLDMIFLRELRNYSSTTMISKIVSDGLQTALDGGINIRISTNFVEKNAVVMVNDP